MCPEWPHWAEQKGLRLDENGALLYGNEEGPYEPQVRSGGETDDAAEDKAPVEPRIDLLTIPAEDLEQTSFI